MLRAIKKAWSGCRPAPRGELIEGPWLAEPTARRAEELVNDFIAADSSRRLGLWLQHRDMRRAFGAVEGLGDPADPALLRLRLPRD
ncbi:MAG: hypothetical protein AB1814_07925 [Thermodesulfobacteriota bacterium]